MSMPGSMSIYMCFQIHGLLSYVLAYVLKYALTYVITYVPTLVMVYLLKMLGWPLQKVLKRCLRLIPHFTLCWGCHCRVSSALSVLMEQNLQTHLISPRGKQN